MTTLPPRITAGVDTHLDVHVAAALNAQGALLGVQSFETTTAGYKALLGWLGNAPVDPLTLQARLVAAGFEQIEIRSNPFGWATHAATPAR